MNRRRAAATCLLVFCLAVSAISPLSSQSLSADSTVPQPRLGLAEPDAALACILGSKTENSSSPELQPAMAGLPNRLLLFVADGGLVRGSNDGSLPTLVSFAEAIRGPPSPNHS